MKRKACPTDVSDEECALVVPYLTLMSEGASQREYPLREVFNGLRYLIRGGTLWRMMPNDLPPWTVVYQQTQRWLKVGVFEANGACPAGARTHGGAQLRQPHANEQDYTQVGELAQQVQTVMGEMVKVALRLHSLQPGDYLQQVHYSNLAVRETIFAYLMPVGAF